MIKSDKNIEEHPFHRILSIRVLNNNYKFSKDPTEKELKQKKILGYLTEIENKFEDLNLSIIFLKSRKISNKIKRSDYVRYHQEFFFINMVSVFDRVLHLVNFNCNLYIPDRGVSKNNVISNPQTPKKIIDFVKRFDTFLKPYRDIQNKIKHKEKDETEYMVLLKAFEHLRGMQNILSKIPEISKEINKDDPSEDEYFKIFIDLQISIMKKNRLGIRGYLNEMLDILNDDFDII